MSYGETRRRFALVMVLGAITLGGASCADSGGEHLVSEVDGMVLVHVPAGRFQMGSAEDDAGAAADEKPLHEAYVDGFRIDRTEVTNAMFGRFVAAEGYVTTAEAEGWGAVFAGEGSRRVAGATWRSPQGPGSDPVGREDHPVVQVSWWDASAYCAWAGRRLPTEAEWEKAARGTSGGDFPWGDDLPAAALCNCGTGEGGTIPVGRYSPAGDSPFGAADMAGNVREWCSDWYGQDAYARSPADRHVGPEAGNERVLRGGSWKQEWRYMRSTARNRNVPEYRCDGVGFRCAVDDKPSAAATPDRDALHVRVPRAMAEGGAPV